MALEAFKHLSGALPATVFGHVLVLDLLGMDLTRHRVLRKPWCPACDPRAASAPAAGR
jgi:hypothetical protein